MSTQAALSCVALLLLINSFDVCLLCDVTPVVLLVNVEQRLPTARELPSTYLSTTVDLSQLKNDQHCNFSSEVFLQLARNLLPNVLRVGGTSADSAFYSFPTHGAPETRCTTTSPKQATAPPPPPYQWTLNTTLWDLINRFALDVGFSIVFGVNAGEGPRSSSENKHVWTADNFETLLQYTTQHNYPVVGYEFSNEPNLFPLAFGSDAIVFPTQFSQVLSFFFIFLCLPTHN